LGKGSIESIQGLEKQTFIFTNAKRFEFHNAIFIGNNLKTSKKWNTQGS
jgi:hypothetical protein